MTASSPSTRCSFARARAVPCSGGPFASPGEFDSLAVVAGVLAVFPNAGGLRLRYASRPLFQINGWELGIPAVELKRQRILS